MLPMARRQTLSTALLVTLFLFPIVQLGRPTLAQAPTPPPAPPPPDFSTVEIKTEKVAEGIYMLTGRGGNIGVSVGPDGVLVIDDQFAPLTDKIKAAIAAISDKPVRFVLNTHWHGDHVGGNENFGKDGAVIVAQDNVRRRLSGDQVNLFSGATTKALPHVALPILTFPDTATFHMNGDSIVAVHLPPAHTDGDAIVRFTKANVVHMGDCMFNGRYPVIDYSAGGSIDGMIRAAELVLPTLNADTRVIPGHGPLADRAALERFRDMLKTVRDRVRPMVKAGKTIDQIVAARPTASLDAAWNADSTAANRFVRVLVNGMRKK